MKKVQPIMIDYTNFSGRGSKIRTHNKGFGDPRVSTGKNIHLFFFVLAMRTCHIMKHYKEEFNMSYFDVLRFQGFVAGVVAEGCLVFIVSVAVILIKNRRMRWR